MSYLAKIDSKDIEDFLNSWKDQIVNIGKVFLEEGDYKKSCLTFIKNHYAFDVTILPVDQHGFISPKDLFIKQFVFLL